MRRLACAIILISVVFVWGCGGSSNTNTGPVTSGLTRRAFVSNQFTSALDIINATDDIVSAHRINTDPGPTVMSLSPDKSVILVATGTGSGSRIDAISTASEAIVGSLSLPDESISFFYQPDSKVVFVSVRNTGQVFRWDTSTSTNSVTSVSIPNARRMVRSTNGNSILVFPDDSSNTIYHIDTTTTPVTVTPVAGFDRPVWAVFSSDGSRAWVLNCGAECGGTAASVQQLNLPALTLGGNAPVAGATFALLNSNTLYVAGTPPATPCSFNAALNCGFLTKVDVSGAPTAGTSFEISDGYHDHMLLAPNNRLYIGAEFTCAAVAPNGCLSIFNTSSNSVVIVPPCGSACNSLNDITGMTTITGRNVVYVVEGGEVRIYDSATDALQSKQVDTVGRSWDVISPD